MSYDIIGNIMLRIKNIFVMLNIADGNETHKKDVRVFK